MFSELKALLFGNGNGAETVRAGSAGKLPLAAAALLVEAATLDRTFDPAERQTVARLLGAHFNLTPDEARELIERAAALVSESVDIYAFTRIIKDGLAPEERIGIIEMLWEVAYADGRVGDYEANLIRRVAGLLYVADKESGEAHQRVRVRLDSRGTSLK